MWMPYIARSQIKFHWSTDWWDGPLSGIAFYQGRMCYFDFFAWEEWDKEREELAVQRKFKLFSLTDGQIALWNEKHELFRQYIGTTSSYDEYEQRGRERVERKDWRDYWQYQWPSAVPDESAIIGWFLHVDPTEVNPLAH